MRLGVLDIGSNAAQLQIVDVTAGGPPLPAQAVKAPTLLGEEMLADGSIGRLIVVPDGPLAMLPFEALVTQPGSGPTFLLDVGPPVIYAPSSAVLKSLVERPPFRGP